ncbi:hypothetical protein M5W83_00715 [Paenibacillus thiaminolyticus]|uniref:Uncharacterized protein n=1 Tax=Paenibacillus thiaminolyticus TaxID=49283 RepID=A0ABT4FSC6_PANTH|nr:hypothetical protein [Paenibacillus thiaminolyticus]MCY9536168.1 hypothetical protein [Paenibacillus thiaminolyticus]MCY9603567.1 hypothetical protein [Paenibacillus thiaminolyticus]MCY9605701.1 hypothetical protein [Paenibacillus thiaminolyticus]MCY9611798.1 hypothetical protein [Paenibacillus thiaminolyticus]MCY9621003.1 hypothetical protein [Paenibacillus thiaminolyticus]
MFGKGSRRPTGWRTTALPARRTRAERLAVTGLSDPMRAPAFAQAPNARPAAGCQ